MFQKFFRKNTESVGDANSQKDYLEYCKSIEQTLSKLESSLHTSDSPEEIAMMAMQTACEFPERIGAAFWKLIWIWDTSFACVNAQDGLNNNHLTSISPKYHLILSYHR